MRYWDVPPSQSEEETGRRLQRILNIGTEWFGAWCVTLGDTPDVIGIVTYHHHEPWYQRLEIGYMLARPYWRRGLMADAVTPLLDHCFQTVQVHRVEITMNPENTAALNLALKLGFQKESQVLRDRIKVAGRFQDQIMLGLLADDWKQRQSSR